MKTPCSYDYEAECKQLRNIVKVLEEKNRSLADENQKLGVQYEDALKKNESLERNIRFLEGEIEAFRYCIKAK